MRTRWTHFCEVDEFAEALAMPVVCCLQDVDLDPQHRRVVLLCPQSPPPTVPVSTLENATVADLCSRLDSNKALRPRAGDVLGLLAGVAVNGLFYIFGRRSLSFVSESSLRYTPAMLTVASCPQLLTLHG